RCARGGDRRLDLGAGEVHGPRHVDDHELGRLAPRTRVPGARCGHADQGVDAGRAGGEELVLVGLGRERAHGASPGTVTCAGVMSTTTTVMLSRPPAASATRVSARATSTGGVDGGCARTSAAMRSVVGA